MNTFLKICLLTLACCGAQLRADSSQHSTDGVLLKDAERPFVSASSSCTGVYAGTATDKPDASEGRANLGAITLDPTSYNYSLVADPITAGKTVSASFSVRPIDFSKDARALVHFRDNAGNDTTMLFNYTPLRFSMSDARIDNVYPDSSISYVVPIVNNTNGPLQLQDIKLLGPDAEFTLDAATVKNQTLQKHDTARIIVHFKASSSKDYSTALQLLLGCDSTNTQSIMLRANVGKLVFLIKDVDFGTKLVGTDWSVDVIAVNNGSLAATLQSLSLKSGTQPFSLKNAASLPLIIAPGASQKVAEVEFKPLSVGSFQDNFSYDVAEDHVGVLSTPIVKGGADPNSGVSDAGDVLLSVQPNPANSTLRIRFKDVPLQPVQLQVYDVDGHSVLSQTVEAQDEAQLPMSALSNGVYLCRFISNGEEHSFRFYVLH